MSKRVLIITYYWPPSGGSGVQRWLKFVKYLRHYGWEPIVYTPSNPESPVIDPSLEKDIPEGITVLKTEIREPYGLYKRFIGRKKDEKINTGFLTEKKRPGLAERIAVWVRGNLFIPDARKWWIQPSVTYLTEYLSKNKVDVIVSTGPPHSMHLIALGLKKRSGIKWLADFRDPWTQIDYYEDLNLTTWADRKHHRLEREVLLNADAVVSVGKTMQEEFIRLLGEDGAAGKFHVITNGYDEDDVYQGEVVPDKKFSIAHIGTMVRTRNPIALWEALSRLVKERKDFAADLELKLAGKVDFQVLDSLKHYGLDTYVNRIDYLPHAEVMKLQQQAQVLLLVLNNTKNAKGILTGKFFEYLAARRPVLCIGPADGDAAEIVRATHSGKCVDFADQDSAYAEVKEYYEQFKKGGLQANSSGIHKFSRKGLTREMAELLKKTCAGQA
ncbi:MAG: glycosyltransferase [Bacteroidota bacterium]